MQDEFRDYNMNKAGIKAKRGQILTVWETGLAGIVGKPLFKFKVRLT